MTTQNLLARVRNSKEFRDLPASAQRGGEAYLESYECTAGANPGLSAWQHRLLAMSYLEVTASPPLTQLERRAARVVRRLVKKETRLERRAEKKAAKAMRQLHGR